MVTGECQEAELTSVVAKEQIKNKLHVLFPNFCLWNMHKNVVLDPKPIDMQKLVSEKRSPQKVILGEWFWLGMTAAVLVTSFFIIDFGDKRKATSSGVSGNTPMVSVGF